MYLFNKKVLISALTLVIGLAMFSTDILAQENNSAELAGQVVDASNQEPVANAQITLQGKDQKATTGDDGTFTFENVEPGTYTLSATAEGYQDWEQEVEVTEQGGAVQISLEPASDS